MWPDWDDPDVARDSLDGVEGCMGSKRSLEGLPDTHMPWNQPSPFLLQTAQGCQHY